MRRWALPRTVGDKVALCVFTFGGVFLLWYQALHILPTYSLYNEWSVSLCFQYVVAFIFALNIYGNMFMLITTDVSGKGEVFPSGSLPPGWKYCDRCVQNCPPRSHHCRLCDTCILKRDHHCWFAGYCIGNDNHRYYFIMVIYIVLAALYCNIFNYDFVHSVKGGWTLGNIASFIVPHAGYMFGYYDLYTCFITALSSIGFTLLFLFSWLLQMQVSQLLRGQTKHERKHGITKYDLGLKDNLVCILGKNWHLTWILPWIPSPLPSDGITFKTYETKAL